MRKPLADMPHQSKQNCGHVTLAPKRLRTFLARIRCQPAPTVPAPEAHTILHTVWLWMSRVGMPNQHPLHSTVIDNQVVEALALQESEGGMEQLSVQERTSGHKGIANVPRLEPQAPPWLCYGTRSGTCTEQELLKGDGLA